MHELNATEVLRRLLDERGVEYTQTIVMEGTLFTVVTSEEYYFVLVRDNDAGIEMWSQYLTPEQAIAATLGKEVTGETSDGYHTFDELYHHRAVLFSVVVRDHAELAWKSKLHHDGTMYDDMFIVGIETPTGQATYHYDIDPYWEMFDCKELEQAPEWDGHTPADAIERIATLGVGTCKNIHEPPRNTTFWPTPHFKCSECGATHVSMEYVYFCPNCGRKVVDE